MSSLRAQLNLPTESQLQSQIVEGLRYAGFMVLECGRYVRQVQCPCGCARWFTPKTGYGNTLGTPDLFVSSITWHPGRWVGLEIKTPPVRSLLGTIEGGRLRKEQRDLADAGRIVVIRSLEEALGALERMEHVDRDPR